MLLNKKVPYILFQVKIDFGRNSTNSNSNFFHLFGVKIFLEKIWIYF